MALANVALTDTFDYWRTVTNSTVVALNDKLIFCNTSNANTVSIPSFASRSSNLTINILTSSSVNDSASGNVASALVVNTVHGLAISYVTAANSNAQISVASANAWSNAVGLASNGWSNTVSRSANSWSNTVGASANAWSNAVNTYSIATYATKISPTFTGTVTIDANIANQTLTDGSTINWDVSLGSVATVTLGGSRTMAAPTNLKIGTYILHVVQDGSGGRSLTWNSVFKWPAGVAPTLTSTANRRDLFSFVCDGTNLYGSYLPDVR
jgi:hypothetical protein